MNTDFRLFSFYGLSLFPMLMRRAFSEHQLPEFTGLWYECDFCGLESVVDACGVQKFSYGSI